MGEVFVSKTSCILSVIILILLILCVGLLVFVLKGQADSQEEEEQNLSFDGLTHGPSPFTGGKTATPSLNNQQDSTQDASLLEDAPWRSYRLSKFVSPDHYDLQLHPNLTTDVFIGTVNITVTVDREMKHFVVHAHKLTIKDAKVYDVEEDVEVKIDVRFPYQPNECYVVQTENKVKAGKYKLYFDFTGSLNGSIVGFYKSRYKNTKNETRRHRQVVGTSPDAADDPCVEGLMPVKSIEFQSPPTLAQCGSLERDTALVLVLHLYSVRELLNPSSYVLNVKKKETHAFLEKMLVLFALLKQKPTTKPSTTKPLKKYAGL
ncbi:endoplasmic reticulum aminopeptidase 1 [Trichonephila clavipes]|nr:endoplasmic reticulum aminopeptidase 1 [Trichonephila clavipes]